MGEKLHLKIFVGEGFTGEEIDFTKFKVAKYTHYTPDGERNISGSLNEQQLNDFLKFEKEGLDGVLAWRKAHNALDKKGREMYQRCVKTLLQVGKKHDEVYRQNTGMRLELIPQQNPYTTTQSLTFQVLFDNKPIDKALVLVWQKGIEKPELRKLRTDKSGKVSFSFEPKGIYMVSTVHMVPYSKPEEADWQSYWGELYIRFQISYCFLQ